MPLGPGPSVSKKHRSPQQLLVNPAQTARGVESCLDRSVMSVSVLNPRLPCPVNLCSFCQLASPGCPRQQLARLLISPICNVNQSLGGASGSVQSDASSASHRLLSGDGQGGNAFSSCSAPDLTVGDLQVCRERACRRRARRPPSSAPHQCLSV